MSGVRLTPQKAAQIKACQGVYTLRDTAKHFGVSPSTVHEAWHGRTHTSVQPARVLPNVVSTRISPEVVAEDGPVLLRRYDGDYARAASELGVSVRTLKAHVSPALVVVW